MLVPFDIVVEVVVDFRTPASIALQTIFCYQIAKKIIYLCFIIFNPYSTTGTLKYQSAQQFKKSQKNYLTNNSFNFCAYV